MQLDLKRNPTYFLFTSHPLSPWNVPWSLKIKTAVEIKTVIFPFMQGKIELPVVSKQVYSDQVKIVSRHWLKEWRIFTQNVFLVHAWSERNFCAISQLEFVSKRPVSKNRRVLRRLLAANCSIFIHKRKMRLSVIVIFVQIFVSATWFIFATSSMHTFKMIWFSATSWGDKSCREGKELHKNSPVHTKRFVSPTCGLITRPVHRKWFIAVTCCSDRSPSLPTFIWEVHVLFFPYRWHYYLL